MKRKRGVLSALTGLLFPVAALAALLCFATALEELSEGRSEEARRQLEEAKDRVEALLAQKNPKATLAFVGDGINDAPVLSRSDVGVAMGALGSDAAIEAADVVLMDDKPSKLATAISIARRTLSIANQNIAFALGVKGIILVLGIMGKANMWAGTFADVGVMVVAVANATRALKVK